MVCLVLYSSPILLFIPDNFKGFCSPRIVTLVYHLSRPHVPPLLKRMTSSLLRRSPASPAPLPKLHSPLQPISPCAFATLLQVQSLLFFDLPSNLTINRSIHLPPRPGRLRRPPSPQHRIQNPKPTPTKRQIPPPDHLLLPFNCFLLDSRHFPPTRPPSNPLRLHPLARRRLRNPTRPPTQRPPIRSIRSPRQRRRKPWCNWTMWMVS